MPQKSIQPRVNPWFSVFAINSLSNASATITLSHNLTKTLTEFINEICSHNENSIVTDLWNVREILAHVTFWHTNYAENYESLVNGTEPPLIDCPLYFANLSGIDSLRVNNTKELTRQLLNAYKSLSESILKNGIRKMTYMNNGRILQRSFSMSLNTTLLDI